MRRIEAEYVILGGGLAGLSAAAELGPRVAVLERSDSPGGLVRTLNFDGYWFDAVLHFLYFGGDTRTEARVLAMIDEPMHPTRSQAYVEFADGVTAFPFQSHLAGLPPDVITACIRDFIETTYATKTSAPVDYGDLLLRTFGRSMCERFFFPYNEKMWRRPLDTLASSGFHWNLARPSVEEILRGALGASSAEPYNRTGWYPRPGRDAPVRGMEVVARALARQTTGLYLGQCVESIDARAKSVITSGVDGPVEFRWAHGCASSLPLPQTIAMCCDVPQKLRAACRSLRHNRVRSVMLSIEGVRPAATGHWRYYPRADVCFTRLIFMCEFDPAMAPPEGWSLIAEIPEPAECVPMPDDEMIAEVRQDIERVNILPSGSRVIDAHVVSLDPAYVVFTSDTVAIGEAARAFLREEGVEPLGRYGRWEYSSMAQVMRDGFAWADNVKGITS